MRLLSTIEVPRGLPPSAIGRWGGCALKLIASAREAVGDRLPTGPQAAIGTFAHRVLERWATGQGAARAEELFADEYAMLVGELRADPRRMHFADLAGTKSLQEWTRIRHQVLERCRRIPRGDAAAPSSPRRAARGGVRSGAERGLSSALLRLSGSADLIRKLSVGAYEVRDFKTGLVVGEGGEVAAEVQMQLRAYGLMVLERDPGARVRLVVDDGEEHEVPFGRDEQERARAEVSAIVARVPPPGLVRVDGIARPGTACAGCAVRHVCPAYRRVAPLWWKSVPDAIERLPNDTWGTVVEVCSGRIASTIDLVVVDAAGRRVCVDGLSSRCSASLAPGGEVACFQFEASGTTRGFNGQRFHARVFHEMPRDAREQRAWAATCFAGVGASGGAELPKSGLRVPDLAEGRLPRTF